ncbi:hypothetical protein L7E55_07670 [Pelotomaculum isophthalicicum JI]|uniref:Uncharacterized protein n=1 Tax=Pelotomaculum isophthalicicum JI TaxID=947010 RepID=A0A9X4H3T4_9FIRM|nr:hypothetical protein [Pelotomaculum isophthalicicum]MDF9408238.1 hypothetical protein [Pelotomaculum isophthalicicum JI]
MWDGLIFKTTTEPPLSGGYTSAKQPKHTGMQVPSLMRTGLPAATGWAWLVPGRKTSLPDLGPERGGRLWPVLSNTIPERTSVRIVNNPGVTRPAGAGVRWYSVPVQVSNIFWPAGYRPGRVWSDTGGRLGSWAETYKAGLMGPIRRHLWAWVAVVADPYGVDFLAEPGRCPCQSPGHLPTTRSSLIPRRRPGYSTRP